MSHITYYRPYTFSIRFVQSTEELLIPLEQQMLLYQFIDIAEDATAIIEGELVIL